MQQFYDNKTHANARRLLTEKEAALYLNCSVGFLRRGRLLHSGPAFVKIGALVRYRAEDLETYISSKRVGELNDRAA